MATNHTVSTFMPNQVGRPIATPNYKRCLDAVLQNYGSFRQSPEKGVYTPEFVKFRAFLHKMACTDSPRKWGARGSPEKGGMPQHSFVLQCKLQLPWAMLVVFWSNFGSSLGFTNGRVNSYFSPTQSTLNNNILYNMRTLTVSGVLVHRSTSRGQCV